MKNAARFLSFLLILVALFGLVTAGLSAKDALDSKNYYEKAGKENDANMKAMDDGLKQLEENEQAYVEGKTALDAVIANPADPGLKSIASRLGEGFTYLKENGTDLDLTKAREVWNAWHAYSDDSGKAITKEIMTRVIAAAALVLAALLALIAAIRGLRGKGCKLVSFLAALLGCGAFAALKIAGSYFSDKAGASAVTLVMIGAIAVGACSLLHWILPRGKKD